MEVLWARAPLTAQQVIHALGHKDWSAATIKTLLNRLLTKGALGFEREGRRYLYSPRISRRQHTSRESKRFVERFHGGRIAPLVASFAEQGGMSHDDIVALKRLLDELEQSDE